MGILDDTAVFTAVIREGGFSHAAKYLGLSNGLVSRRIARLEAVLGVTLIKRTTRQFHLTPEGELFWEQACRMQEDLEATIALIQSQSRKPQGLIRISAPPYFGRQYLWPMINTFMRSYPDLSIDMLLSNQMTDPIKEKIDIVIRGAGYFEKVALDDSSLKMKLLVKEKMRLYASQQYLKEKGSPSNIGDLAEHAVVSHNRQTHGKTRLSWSGTVLGQPVSVKLSPQFSCNDIGCSLQACIDGAGIGRFTELNARDAEQKGLLQPILPEVDWGDYHLYMVYPHTRALPTRSKLLLDFMQEQALKL